MTKIKITPEGIKSILKDHHFSEENYYRAIAEFIWNGFDAKATVIELTIQTNQRGRITKLVIKDNGVGIDRKIIDNKFDPIYESEKAKQKEKNLSNIHGSRGIGRFTFITFSHFATWTITYEEGNKKIEYKVKMSSDKSDAYEIIGESKESIREIGTEVEFEGFLDNLLIEKNQFTILNYLKREFGWFLELNKSRRYQIIVNSIPLDYSDIIGEKAEDKLIIGVEKYEFDIEFIRWDEKINGEYSRYYFLDGNSIERRTECTTLNKKRDDFYHSVYVKSSYFNEFNFNDVKLHQKGLVKNRNDASFKELKSKLDLYLKKKRKPFIKECSKKIIQTLKDDGILTSKPVTEFTIMENTEIEGVIKCIYEIQPSIFNGLNQDQKKTIIRMLELVLSSEDRGKLLDIISQITALDATEKKELEELLQVTTLSNIIRMAAILKNRFTVLQLLKKIVFVEEFGANEVDHLQKVVENHTWIFGEEYTLLAAAEDDFETALRNFRAKVFDETETTPMTDKEKRKQVDVFICKKLKQNGKVNNIIIELKSPKISLGKKQLEQIKDYLKIIKNEGQFNAEAFDWTYILMGKKYDSTGWIEDELESNTKHDKPGLIHALKNHQVFVKKWSDLIQECEDRLDFLNSKLNIQKEDLIKTIKNPEEAVAIAQSIKEKTS